MNIAFDLFTLEYTTLNKNSKNTCLVKFIDWHRGKFSNSFGTFLLQLDLMIQQAMEYGTNNSSVALRGDGGLTMFTPVGIRSIAFGDSLVCYVI